MLSPFQEADRAFLQAMVATLDDPGWLSDLLRNQLSSHPQSFRLWRANGEPVGFVALTGGEYPILWGHGLSPEYGSELEAMLKEAIIPLQTEPGVVAIAAVEARLWPLTAWGFEEITLLRERVDLNWGGCSPWSVPTGYSLLAWEDRYQAAVAELIERANRGKLESATLCFPNFATPAGCSAWLTALRNGASGTFRPDISSLLIHHDQLIGIVLVTQRDRSDEVFLSEIALDPRYEGQGLGRGLILHTRTVAKRSGLTRFGFCFRSTNSVIGRFFDPAEILRSERETLSVWLKERRTNDELEIR